MIRNLAVTFIGLSITGTSALASGADTSQAPATVVVTAAETMPAGSFYGALSFGGLNLDASITQDIDPEDAYYRGNIDAEAGTGVLGALGYDFGNGVRVEVELSRFKSTTGDLTFPNADAPFNGAETDGDLRLTSGMVNGWYTFGTGSVRPFIGLGLGMMEASIDTAFELGSNNGITDKDRSFAYMVGAGVEMPVSETISVVGSYRYLTANSFNMTDNEDTDIESDFDSHVVSIGALIRF